MNILTKICVVVLLVSSLIACVVFVNMATNVPNYRYNYEQEQLKSKQREAKILAQMDSVAKSQRAAATREKEIIEKESAFQTGKDTLQASLTEAKLEIDRQKRVISGLQASLAGLSISQQAHVKTNSDLHKDLAATREDAQQKHAAAMNSDTLLKKSQAKAELLEREMSVLKQRAKRQKADYIRVSERLALLEKQYGVADVTASTDPLLPAERVTGTITAIRDNLASINIGTSNGLKKGMSLIIYRGADYVGRLKLENVDVNEAAGILMDGNPLSPLKGDKVTTKLD